MAFAKDALKDRADQFGDFPIYFYATGGMRQLSSKKREKIINAVRKFLKNDIQCPFFFKNEFARVISGEEEAIFSWAATNFLMGTLLPASAGEGVVSGVNSTYGTIDLGGASTQIAYFLPSQDILEGLYKFQIGNQKIWNVYTKSFLQFGIVSARQRHITGLVDSYLSSQSAASTKHRKDLKVINSCFYAGYSEKATDSDESRTVEVAGPELPEADQLKRCMDLLRPLMEKKNNAFCDQVYHGDCSIAGSYQPPLPGGDHGKFIGTSSLVLPWSFLQLPATATMEELKAKASGICQMNFDDIMFYYEVNFSGAAASSVSDNLPYFCFMSSYVIVLLEDGYKFADAQTLTVKEQVNGNRMGWALGAILYEINEFPWEYNAITVAYSWFYVILAALIGFLVGAVAAVFVYREVVESPYTRLNQSEVETDSFENLKRVSTVELLRRRGDSDIGGYNTMSERSIAPTSAPTPRYSFSKGSANPGIAPTSSIPSPYKPARDSKSQVYQAAEDP